jgi:hypothetical protein
MATTEGTRRRAMKYSEFKDQVIDITEVDGILANLSVVGEPFGYSLEDIFSVAFAPVRRYIRNHYRQLLPQGGSLFSVPFLNIKHPSITYRLHALRVENYRRYHAVGSVVVDGVPALLFVRGGREGSDYINTYILNKEAASNHIGYLITTSVQFYRSYIPAVQDSDLLDDDRYTPTTLATVDDDIDCCYFLPSDLHYGAISVMDDEGEWVPLDHQPSPLSYDDIKDTVIGTTNRLDLVPGLALRHLIGGDLYGVTDKEFLVGVESNHITCITHAYLPPLTELTIDQVDTYVQRAAPHKLYQHHVCSILVRGTPAFYFIYVWDSDDLTTRLDIYILNEDACNDFLQVVIRLLLQDIKVAPYEVVERSVHYYVDASDKVEDLTVSDGTRILYGNY